MIRRLVVLALSLLGVVLLAGVIAVVLLTQIDVRPHVESFASGRLGRPVTIQSLTVGWGNPIRLEAAGVRVANSAWGTTPDMVSIGRAHADIAPWPLLHGQISLNNVGVDNPVLVLEHGPDGTGNWVSPNGAGRHGTPQPADPPPIQFIRGMTLRDGELTLKTTQHHTIRIHVAKAELLAADATAPLNVHAEGTYNDLPLVAKMVFESFDALRSVPRPVGTEIVVSGGSSGIRFEGTMTDPLNFDGAMGKLELTAQTLNELSRIAGTPNLPNTKLALTGSLDRQGEKWLWTNLSGSFAGTTVAGTLGLDEGARGKPDHFNIGLDFATLDLHHLAAGMSSNDHQSGVPLNVEENPSEIWQIKIGIKEALYQPYKFDAVRLEADTEPAKITLHKLSFGFADGRVELSGTDQAAGDAGHILLNASASQMNAARLLTLAGSDTPTLTGKLAAAATLEMTGKTTRGLSTLGSGQLILAMNEGQVSRHFLELASVDPRILFQKTSGFASVICLLGVATMRNGIASVTPLRLRTSEGNLYGGGQIDLRRDEVNVVLRSDGQSTSFWALDVPLHITGSLSSPRVLPFAGTNSAQWDFQGLDNLRLLPARLRQLIGGRC